MSSEDDLRGQLAQLRELVSYPGVVLPAASRLLYTLAEVVEPGSLHYVMSLLAIPSDQRAALLRKQCPNPRCRRLDVRIGGSRPDGSVRLICKSCGYTSRIPDPRK